MKQANAWREKRKRNVSVWGYLFMGCLFLAVAAASLKMPSVMLDWQDEKRVGRSETLPAQEVVLYSQEDMTLFEKLELIASDDMHVLSMENGKHYTKESVMDKSLEELEKLAELGILTDLDLEEAKTFTPEVAFLLDTENGERSMMVWDGRGIFGQWVVEWQMDDETGKILLCSQSRHVVTNASRTGVTDVTKVSIFDADGVNNDRRKEVRYTLDAEQTFHELAEKADKWGEYLGCSLKQVGPALNGIEYQEEVYQQIEEKIKFLEEKGYPWIEAYYMTCAEFGTVPDDVYGNQYIYALYEDAGDLALFYLGNRWSDEAFLIINNEFYF